MDGMPRVARAGVVVALLAACFGTALPARAADAPKGDGAKKPVEAYRLQPGDEVAITVSPQKGYDAKGTILPDGVLRLAPIGKIVAAGMTLDELEAYCKKVLSADLKMPDITATLEKLHVEMPIDKTPPTVKIGVVTITGAVVKPGPVDLEEGLRLKKAIDNAGGPTKDANLDEILIVHKNLTKTIVDLSKDDNVVNPDHNLTLQDGDSVSLKYLPLKDEAPPANIDGQVINPGSYPVKDGATLESLITQAGKLTLLADLERVQIQRAGEKDPQIVNLIDRQNMGLSGQVPIKPGDKVWIGKQKDTITILGMIPKAGPRAFKPGTTVRDFFQQGGEDLSAAMNPALVDLNNAELIRNGEEKSRKLPLKDILRKKDHPLNVALETGDVIYLPDKTSKSGGLLSKITQIAPLATLFAAF